MTVQFRKDNASYAPEDPYSAIDTADPIVGCVAGPAPVSMWLPLFRHEEDDVFCDTKNDLEYLSKANSWSLEDVSCKSLSFRKEYFVYYSKETSWSLIDVSCKSLSFTKEDFLHYSKETS